MIRNVLRRSCFVLVAVLLTAPTLLSLAHPIKAHATGSEPVLTGGSNVTGVVDTEIHITDLQVSGTGNPTVPVSLYVPSGTLSMGDATGLTFTGSDTGSSLQFSGTLTDVNNALATLRYTTPTPQNISLQATITAPDQAYNPTNGHLYEVFNVGDGEESGITATDARTAAATHTQLGLTGYLVTITSADENNFVSTRINSNSWIGATDNAEEGRWVWDQGPEAGTYFWQGQGHTGSVISGLYNNWADGEPNNSDIPNENCGEFYSGEAKWNDLNCDHQLLNSYIVEYGSDGNLPTVASKTVGISVTYPTGTPRSIDNCDDLRDIAADPMTYRYDTITLTQDIDCSNNLDPMFLNTSFRGTFDGGSPAHKISNVSIEESSTSGLIGQAERATIKNVILDGGYVASNECVGAVLGTGVDTVIQGVSSNWDVYANYKAGGLEGCMDIAGAQTSKVTQSSSTGSITSYYYEGGGIVGYVTDGGVSSSGSFEITNNSYNGEMSTAATAGGIVGDIDTSRLASGTISHNTFAGYVSGQGSVGGMVGNINTYGTSHTITIANNSSTAELYSTGSVGGMVGYMRVTGNAETAMQILDNSFSGTFSAAIDQIGGMVGYSYIDNGGSITLRHDANTADVIASGSQIGGLIGYADEEYGNTIVVQSYNTGAVHGANTVGGLVGQINNYTEQGASDVTLQDSYSTGGVIANSGSTVGGIVGYLDAENDANEGVLTTVHLKNVYSSGDVQGNSNVGGLVGYVNALYWNYNDESNSKVYVDSSFSTSHLTSNDVNTVGGLYGQVQYDAGVDDIHSTNNFWDKTRSGAEGCAGTNSISFGSTNCTPVNAGENQPDYFKFNNSNAPYTVSTDHKWDYDDTWGFKLNLNNNLPCLQWQDESCSAIPSHSSATLTSAEDGTPIALNQNGCSAISTSSTSKESGLSVQDPAYLYPVGFASFALSGCGPSATITATFTGNFDTSKVLIRKYNAVTRAFTTLTPANSSLALTSTTLNNHPALQVSYVISDGGLLDQDSVIGTITDPIGIGVNIVAAPNTGLGGKR